MVTKGEGTLRDYRFGKGGMAHLFCGVCGTAVLGRMEGYPPGVNVSPEFKVLIEMGCGRKREEG